MDQITHEVREDYWRDIIRQCQERPEGMSARRWIEENGINIKSYYYWQRKLRIKAYEQQLPMVTAKNAPVAFAELKLPESVHGHATSGMKATATVRCGDTILEFSNDVSGELAARLLKEVFHA